MVYESIIQGMSSIASVYLSVIFITILVQKAVFVYKTQFFSSYIEGILHIKFLFISLPLGAENTTTRSLPGLFPELY